MSKDYQIKYQEQPAWAIIGGGISEYNKQQAGPDNGKNLCFVVQGPDEEIIGGVIGSTHWEWLNIDLMWLKEAFRQQGYGSQLLTKAEEEGRKRGAKYAYLDTFSFQALDFYKKYGYEIFGELNDFPQGHTRYYLKKNL